MFIVSIASSLGRLPEEDVDAKSFNFQDLRCQTWLKLFADDGTEFEGWKRDSPTGTGAERE